MDVPERIKQGNSRLEHLTGANDRWEDAAEHLAEDWEVLKLLIAYYETEWRDDVENYPEAPYGVLSEDGVWNEMGRFYESLKAIRDAATRIVREYESSGDPEVDPGAIDESTQLIDEP